MQKPETDSLLPDIATPQPRHIPSSQSAPASVGNASGQSLMGSIWREIVAPWWHAAVAIFPAFVMSRFIFLLLTYFGGVLFFVPNYSPMARSLHDVIYTWNRWDAIHYTNIAAQGYLTTQNTAFFPLFPTLIRLVSNLFHMDLLVAGMLVSNLAFFGALVVLYRFVESEFDGDIARRTALYLSIFPTAFFFFAAYNESLFLFFMLLCFYYLRRGHWWAAGLAGALATLTRSIGIFLAVIFFCEFVRQAFSAYKARKQPVKMKAPTLKLPAVGQSTPRPQPAKRSLLSLFGGLPAILLIPLALGIYAYGLKVHLDDPLAFMHAQVSWRESLSAPWVAPLKSIQMLLHNSPFTFVAPHIIIELTALGLFLVLLILTFVGPERFKSHQWTLILFGLMALVYAVIFPGTPGTGTIPYDPMPSMQRFVLEIFPGFIMLALLGKRRWFHLGYLLIALPMLAFLVLQFLTGHWTV